MASVVDLDLGDVVVSNPRDDGAGGAAVAGDSDEVATVEIRALQRKEQLSLADRPGIGADPGKLAVRAVQRPPHARRCARRSSVP